MGFKKRILILANHGIGLYNFRLELIQKLIELKYEVYISLPDGERVSDLEKLGCIFISTPIDRRGINPVKDLFLFGQYLHILGKVRPDAVLSYTIKPNIYGGIACRIKRVPYIVNITGLGTTVQSGFWIRHLVLGLYKTALKQAYCIFFQNQFNYNFFKQNRIGKMCRYRKIPGSGVNLSHFPLLEYPSAETTIEFVFIGRIMKEKGIEEYAEAARYIKAKYPQTVFHVIGFCETAYQDYLEKLVQENIVEYHGLQSDIRPFLESIHCTVHPSYYPEGISNVLLESVSSGRPVITTTNVGCREIVENGKNGFICEMRDIPGLIGAIDKFIQLPEETKRQMGVNGRRKVEREFDRNTVVQAYLYEIDEIMK